MRKKQKKTSKTSKTPRPRLSKEDKEAIAGLLRSVIENPVRSSTANRGDADQEALEKEGLHLTEFFDSYILLGYSFSGQPVKMFFAPTQQQANSLTKLLIDFLNIEEE